MYAVFFLWSLKDRFFRCFFIYLFIYFYIFHILKKTSLIISSSILHKQLSGCPVLYLTSHVPIEVLGFQRLLQGHCNWLLLGKFQGLNSGCEIYTASVFFFLSLNYFPDSLFTFKVSFFPFLFGNLCNKPIFFFKKILRSLWIVHTFSVSTLTETLSNPK